MSYSQVLQLKDGFYLFISEDDTMKMVDKDGKPIKMQDGVEMELKDGTLIMMMSKNFGTMNIVY